MLPFFNLDPVITEPHVYVLLGNMSLHAERRLNKLRGEEHGRKCDGGSRCGRRDQPPEANTASGRCPDSGAYQAKQRAARKGRERASKDEQQGETPARLGPPVRSPADLIDG